MVYAKQLGDLMLINVRSDYAKTSDHSCRAVAYVCFSGYVVKVDPLSVLACYDSLSAQYDTVLHRILQLVQTLGNAFLGKFLSGLTTEAFKHLVSMVMVMTVVVLMIVIVIVATAGAMFTVFMMMLVLVFMLMLMLVFMLVMMVVIMMVIMASASAVFIVFMMMFMLMIMVIAAALFPMCMMVVMLMRQTVQLGLKCVRMLHCLAQLGA